MNIQISGRHLEITDPIRDYASERGERLFRYFDRIQKVHIVLSREGARYSAEVVVSAPKGVRLAAEASEEGLQASVDKVVDRMERQITRFKEKLQDHRRDAVRSARKGPSDEALEEGEEGGEGD